METADNAVFHIVLVKAWIRRGERYLLARRAHTELQAPGEWSLPGGKVDRRDGADVLFETLRDEAREEVGVELGRRFDLVLNNAFERVDGAHVIGLSFLCDWQSGEPEALDQTVEVRWATLDELRDMNTLPSFMRREVQALLDYVEAGFKGNQEK